MKDDIAARTGFSASTCPHFPTCDSEPHFLLNIGFSGFGPVLKMGLKYSVCMIGSGPGILGGPAGPILKPMVLGIKYSIIRLWPN